jgi:hypothetical protein
LIIYVLKKLKLNLKGIKGTVFEIEELDNTNMRITSNINKVKEDTIREM